VKNRGRLGGALALIGKKVNPADLYLKLRPQLKLLGPIGGLTVSGGEPLAQADQLCELLELCKKDGLHTAVETSAGLDTDRIRTVEALVDCWLVSLLPLPEESSCAGVPRPEQVLSNLSYLSGSRGEVIVRMPIIPGVSDRPGAWGQVADVLETAGLRKLEILPFNRLSSAYYAALGEDTPCPCREDIPDKVDEKAVEYFLDLALEVRLVG